MPEPVKDVKPVDASSTSAPAAPETTPQDGGGAELSQNIPYTRFKEVNDQLKAYKELGMAPEELGELFEVLSMIPPEQLQQVLTANRGSDPNRTTAPAQPDDAETKQLRAMLERAYPELAQMKQMVGGMSAAQQRQQVEFAEARAERATSVLTGLATEAGYTAEDAKQLEPVVVALIDADPALLRRWRTGDVTVVNEAFQRFASGLTAPLVRSAAAKTKGIKDANKRGLAPNVQGGTAPGTKPPEKPKNLEQARALAISTLKESDFPEEE